MSDDSRIDDLLDQWEDAQERGESLDLDRLCGANPALRSEIERRIQALQTIDFRLGVQEPAAVDQEAPALAFDCEIDRLTFHAKGGLGAVFVGEDRQLNRQVAIKFIHRALAADQESCDRFQLEAEVTGRLEHPGVIPMYGVGQTEDGRPFYAMRYIDGHTLDEAIRQYYSGTRNEGVQSLEFRRLLSSFVSVCKTIAYAHNRGIVHRDMKPDNVMLGRYGETIVVDWGLAVPVSRDERFRISGEKTLLPKSGSGSSNSSRDGAGTPAYMSPEQASELAPTPACDVYSLGATLFKILTGRPPVAGDSLLDVRTKVIDGKIPRPTELRKDLPKALEAICMKAMALRPRQRYATALDLARDIEHFLADEPIEVHRETAGQRFSRLLRRHRSAAFAAIAGLASCLVIAGFSAFWLARAAHHETLARINSEQSKEQAQVARRDNLGMSAKFLAKSLAYEIDLRWRILESEADSPELRQHLAQVNTETSRGESHEALQRWLEKRYIVNQSAITTACWAVVGIEGTQQARVPEMVGGRRAASLGKNYRRRDYFHGEGKDLSEVEVTTREKIPPLANKDVYVSAVFQGSNTNTLMVTFSVPIWSGPPEDPDRHKIGVLCAPVELGDFALGHHALLVDTRQDQLTERKGLVLHHPELGHRSLNDKLHYLADTDLEFAQKLEETKNDEMHLEEAFIDPISGQPRLAALEPVVIRGRQTERTGWVVVVIDEQPRS